MCIFAFQADNITARSFHILLIAVPILIQVYFNSSLAYGLMKWLKVPHSVAALPLSAVVRRPDGLGALVVTQDGARRVEDATTGAPDAQAEVHVLVEVPVMLSVCSFCNRTKHWFPTERRFD